MLELLLRHPGYRRVNAPVRRALEPPPGVTGDKLDAPVVDFDDLDGDLLRVDDVFCCLGTTLAKAGSREAFRRVDHDLVVAIARGARDGGATRLFLVSAIGASPGAMSFYSRVKGEMEADVEALGYGTQHLFRPSLLLGKRNEHRPAERAGIGLARTFGWMLAGPLRPYHAVEGDIVAAAMVGAADSSAVGRHVHTYASIRRLADTVG